MPPDPDDALLPISEAARRLGVTADTIRRWEASGRLSSIRTLGNQRRFRESEIEALRAPSEAAS